MDFNNLLNLFKERCKLAVKFINTKTGRNLFLAAAVTFILLFFAPLFQGAVGAALISCVAAPLVVMIWRRKNSETAVVPAVFLCIPMILSMLIYHTLSTAVCLLVALVCNILLAVHPAFKTIISIKDNMYAYLTFGGVCAVIVVLASLLILLVSIAWWLFCLLLFLGLLIIFFSVVLSTAAYTATDDKRQAKKKREREYNADTTDYDFDTFAEDIGLKSEGREYSRERRRNTAKARTAESVDVTLSKSRKKKEPLFYDID